MSPLDDSNSSSGFMEVESSMLDTPARMARDKRQADLEANRRAAMAQMPYDQQQGVGPIGGALGEGQVPQLPQLSAGGSQNDTNGAVPSSQQPAGAAHQTHPPTGQVQQSSSMCIFVLFCNMFFMLSYGSEINRKLKLKNKKGLRLNIWKVSDLKKNV